MSEISRTDLISFIAGSLAGESPLCVEDAVAAALRLVDEFDDHGWVMIDDSSPLDDDDLRLEFDELRPTMLSVSGKVYDIVERTTAEASPIAQDLAVRFDELAEQERSMGIDDPITVNDTMVAATIAEPRKISWLGSDGVSIEAALRHAAWVVALADPLQDRFPKVLRAVMAT